MLYPKSWPGCTAVALVIAMFSSGAEAKEMVAFVTEVQGTVEIKYADGSEGKAELGTQLAVGDEIRVVEGKAAFIFASGRSVELESGMVWWG
jgi:hypothetical protein